MKVKVGSLEFNDIPALHRLGMQELSIQGRNEGRFWSVEQLQRMIGSDDIILVAKDGSMVIGFVIACVHHSTSTALIWDIFVKDRYRGRLARQQLMLMLRQRAISAGVTHIQLLIKAADAHQDKGFINSAFPGNSSPMILREVSVSEMPHR